jgi:HK97 family phage prohead protease
VTTLERRTGCTELRTDGRRLYGRVVPFNVEAEISGFREMVAPGAFRNSLASGADIVALQDHDPTRLLGRTRANTLKLREDPSGLLFDLDLPMTSVAADVLELVRSGNAGGMSFGFVATREDWPKADQRILRSIDLREVSVVSWQPAYDGTEVAARSRQAARMTYAASRLRLWTRTL